MHFYLSLIRKKKESYGKFINDGFIYDELNGVKYLLAVVEDLEDKIKCVFITKAEVEDTDYLLRCNVENRGILHRAIESKGIQVQGFTMSTNYNGRLCARMLTEACLHYYPDTFPEIDGKKTANGFDPILYVEKLGDNPLLQIYRTKFNDSYDYFNRRRDLGEKPLFFKPYVDTYTWSSLTKDYLEINNLINEDKEANNKRIAYDFIFIMKDIDKYSKYIIDDFSYKLKKYDYLHEMSLKLINFVDLFGKKLDDDTKIDNDNLFTDNTLTVIRMPYDYYRVYEHADEYSKEPTTYRDIDMTLFDNAKYIKNKVDAIIKGINAKSNKSIVMFLCDNEIDYDKNGLFHNELRNNSFKVINLNEISSKNLKEYFSYKLNSKGLDTLFADFLLNDFMKHNVKGLMSTNVRVLDAHFDKWYSDISFKKHEIDETSYKEIIDKNKTGKELLDEMVGEVKVKEQIEKICANFEVQRIREHEGCKKAKTNKHMFFIGNPGTGKTEMARIIAKLLYEKGIINNDKIVEVGVDEITSQWVGHTEDVCKAHIEEAIGGILFIDEAYALMNDKVGKAAIDVLVKEMENNRDRLIVIMAGYKKQMMELLELNTGLRSRIAKLVDFDDFTIEELMGIAKKVAGSQDYYINNKGLRALKKICEKEKGKDDFGNGRTVRTIIESAIENQSYRIRPQLEKYCNDFSCGQNDNVSMSLLNELDERDFVYETQEEKNNYFGFGIN